MNLAAAAPIWLYLLLLAFLAAGAVEDIVRLRISNLTCAAVALLAVIAILVVGPAWDLWQNFAVFAAILVVGTAAFAAGFVGGGDVKLLAAVGLWVPLKAAALLLATTLLAGGAIALVAMLFWAFRKSSRSIKTRQIPYGLAISLGAALVLQSARN